MSTSLRRVALLGCSTVALTAFGTAPAGAQAPSASETNSSTTAPKDELVVTARRRQEDIQSVPVSVQAFTDQKLQREHVATIKDLTRLVPGVVFNGSGSDFNTTFNIRGQGRAVIGGISPSVQTYDNDVPLPTWGAVLPTYDMASIQVLKGPQGTLFGRNTTGGAVLVYTQQPTHDFEGYVSAGTGSFQAQDFEGAVNIPVDDKVSLRFAAQRRKRDGYTKGGVSGLLDGNNLDNQAYRASLLIEPTDNLKNVTVYEYYKVDNVPAQVPTGYSATFDGGVGAAYHFLGAFLGDPAFFDCGVSPSCDPDLAIIRARDDNYRRYYSDIQPLTEAEVNAVTNTTTFSMDNGVTIKNIFGYRKNRISEVSDTDANELHLIDSVNVKRSDDQFSDELQISGAAFDDQLDWLVGGFWLQNKPRDENGIGFRFYEVVGVGALGALQQQQQIKEESKAVFGSISWKLDNLVEGLKLNASARYTWDDVASCSAVGLDPTAPMLRGFDACNTSADPTATTAMASFKQATWSAGLDYQATSDLFLYAVVRRGYRAGVLNAPVLGGAFAPFQSVDPQLITDYEIGAKTDWSLGSISGRTNVSAFYSDIDDLQIIITGLPPNADGDGNPLTDPAFTSFYISGGSEKTYGVELDGYAELLPNLRLTYGASYLHTEIDYDIPVSLAPFTPTWSTKSNYSPKWSYSLGGEYVVPGVALGGDVILNVDWYHIDPFKVDFATNDGYGLLNAGVTFENIGDKGVSLQVFGTNLTDEIYFLNPNQSGSSPGYQTWEPGPPRMWGVKVRYDFGPN